VEFEFDELIFELLFVVEIEGDDSGIDEEVEKVELEEEESFVD